MSFDKTTCVSKGVEYGPLMTPPPTFGAPASVFRWGKQHKEPEHRFDIQRFEQLKKHIGPREAMAQALVIRRTA